MKIDIIDNMRVYKEEEYTNGHSMINSTRHNTPRRNNTTRFSLFNNLHVKDIQF